MVVGKAFARGLSPVARIAFRLFVVAKVSQAQATMRQTLSPGVCPRVIINRLLAIDGAKDRRVEETIKNKAYARHFLIFSHNNLYV